MVVRSEKELSVPAKIGDYELTAADKYLLANGHSLDNKMIHTPEGYIITDIAMLPDKKDMLSQTSRKYRKQRHSRFYRQEKWQRIKSILMIS